MAHVGAASQDEQSGLLQQEPVPQRASRRTSRGLAWAVACLAAIMAAAAVLSRRGPDTTDMHGQLDSTELFDPKYSCTWLDKDNCKNSDATACKCRDLNPDGPCTPCPQSTCRRACCGDDCPDDAAAPSDVEPLVVEVSATEPAASVPSDVEPLVDVPTPTMPPAATAAAAKKRKGSFLVIGDWGWDEGLHGNVRSSDCQISIGERMLEEFKRLGDVQFILNVGDSFYPHGVHGKDDPQWDTKWRNRYDPLLRSVPWYSVYGNHDYQQDPCTCTDTIADCAQVNFDAMNLDYFFMPGVNWYKTHPELDLEVVGLDLNHYMLGWDGSRTSGEQEFEDCQWTGCKASCQTRSKARAAEAFDMFKSRTKESKMKNMLVFSHYPTDYFHSEPWFLQELSDASSRDIFYFGGHRHNTDNTTTTPITPNVNWVVGGGGGWSCDGPQQGFVVGEIGLDAKIATYPVFVDKSTCCGGGPPKLDCNWIENDNCVNNDATACGCRALHPSGPCTKCPDSKCQRPCCGKHCKE